MYVFKLVALCLYQCTESIDCRPIGVGPMCVRVRACELACGRTRRACAPSRVGARACVSACVSV